MRRGPQFKSNHERLWLLRDAETQLMFSRIDRWLARPDNKGQFNTKYYDSICKQWLAFACITDRQKDVLKNIIERWSIPE